MAFKDWTAFFCDAGISSSEAYTYTAAFVQHNIRSDMVEDLDKDDLRDMGITAIGDIKRILKYVKKDNLHKHSPVEKEQNVRGQIESWIKAESIKSEERNNVSDKKAQNEDINTSELSYVDDDNDIVMARVEKDIPAWRNKTQVPQKEISRQAKSLGHDNGNFSRQSFEGTMYRSDKNEIRCEVCNKPFKNMKNQEYHVQSIHLNIKRYKCDTCPYQSYSHHNLKSHKKRVHLNLKRYECQECPFKTNKKTLCQRPLKEHS